MVDVQPKKTRKRRFDSAEASGGLHTRLRSLRELTDMNQTEYASRFELSQTGYSKYETGMCDPAIKSLIEIAVYHNTSVDYILNLTEEKKPYPRRRDVLQKYRDLIRLSYRDRKAAEQRKKDRDDGTRKDLKNGGVRRKKSE